MGLSRLRNSRAKLTLLLSGRQAIWMTFRLRWQSWLDNSTSSPRTSWNSSQASKRWEPLLPVSKRGRLRHQIGCISTCG